MYGLYYRILQYIVSLMLDIALYSLALMVPEFAMRSLARRDEFLEGCIVSLWAAKIALVSSLFMSVLLGARLPDES